MITIFEPRPKVDLPGQAPSGAAISAEDQRLMRSFHQLRRTVPGNICTREYAPEMRYVTMIILRIVYILHPLLQLAIFTDLVRRYLLILCPQCLTEGSICL